VSEVKQVNRQNKWGKNSRHYEIDGEIYPSVTSILGAVSKPALIPWAAKVEREACISTAWDIYQARDNGLLTSKEAFLDHFTLRLGKEKAHAKKMSQAADLGSEAHKRIEWLIRQELQLPVEEEPSCRDEALWAVMAYEDWRKKANMAPLLTEKIVYSKRYKYAGTMDLACEMDTFEYGRIHAVTDFKSSKGIWPEMLLQNAAYTHALIEMGLADPPVHGAIVRLPKTIEDPEFEVRLIPAEDMKRLFKVFLSVLDLSNWLEQEK